MINNTQQPDIATIHHLLLAAFTVEELDRLFRFSSNPQLQNVAQGFSPGDGLTMMTDKAISYCQRHLLLPDLLAEVRRVNPRQYARFLGPDQAEHAPAPPTPGLALSASDRDALTISHPIALQLVRVPAGEFLMGSVMARDKNAEEHELPPHRVYVPGFHIGQYPVTNFQYQTFVKATGHRMPRHLEQGTIPGLKVLHPVVHVSWEDAVAFCDWLRRETQQPFHLPTEAEWEKAARGTGGRIYPWGGEPPDEDRCNFNKNIKDTTTIGRYSPQGDSPYGCADMAGNVWEWCQSRYEPYPYQAGDGRENLEAGSGRVLRGGAWYSEPAGVRCAFRAGFERPPRGYRHYGNGFRVCVAVRQD